MSDIIKKLSAKTINKIAAGEVIVSPVNVVKELIENSIDALSTKIDITLEHGGRNLIKVVDNGSGISGNDLPLVVERYATSKLSEEDLTKILYMGFRGEAMHSIATVSRLLIISKHSSSNLAWSLSTEGGQKITILPAKLLCGTTVIVRDLFFSTPTRIKFLRSEKTELGHIIDTINKLAIVHPHISFDVTADGKKIIEYKNCTDLHQRICEVKKLSRDLANSICFREFEEENYKIALFASMPTISTTQSNFYIFINKRPVHDIAINSAIKSAYFDYIPQNRFPFVIIFLSMPPNEVDVNIHPTKNEVRILNIVQIKKFISSSITKTIAKADSLFTKEDEVHVTKKHLAPESRNQDTKSFSNLSDRVSEKAQNHFLAKNFPKNNVNEFTTNESTNANPTANYEQIKPKTIQSTVVQKILIPEKKYSIKCQLYDTYIVVEKSDEIILIDQHAAHERLLYEKFKKNLNKESQILLVSEVVELPLDEVCVVEENKELLDAIGLGIERFGKNLIVIQKIPTVLQGFNLKVLLKDLISDDFLMETSLVQKVERVYANIACKNAIKANTKLSNEEMEMIIADIESTDFSAQCNHGRPTYIKIEKTEIEKKFKRR